MPDRLYINYLNRSSNSSYYIDINEIENDMLLFEFNEYEDVSISIESENYHFRIECLSYLDSNNNFYSTTDNILNLQNNKAYIISKNDNEDIGYLPDKYQAIIYNKEKEIDCYFRVNCNNEISNEGLSNIIEAINSFIADLTIDYNKSNTLNGIKTNIINKYNIYELLSKNKSKMSLTLDRISSDLKMNVISSVVATRFPQKQNSTSIKMNLTKAKDTSYSVKKIQSTNNDNNIILKKYLLKLSSIIDTSIIELANEITNKYNHYIELSETISNNKKIIKRNTNVFNNILIENHNKNLKSNQKSLYKWYKKLKEWFNSINSISLSVRRLLDSNELKIVDINNQITHSPDYNLKYEYKYIMDLYLSLINQNTSLFSYKSSYKIFEIYGFIILNNILLDLGFNLLKDKNDIDFNNTLDFTYINNNSKIIIKYDYFCEKYNNSNSDSIVNINSNNCKPDYILLFYDNNILKNIIIIEMKYRNLKYLIDYNGGITDTDATVDDYFQLGYLEDINSIPKRVVRRVLVFYPSKNEYSFNRYLANFIGINSNTNKEGNSYNLIKSIIKENIN